MKPGVGRSLLVDNFAFFPSIGAPGPHYIGFRSTARINAGRTLNATLRRQEKAKN
jgi:hypothetical protein